MDTQTNQNNISGVENKEMTQPNLTVANSVNNNSPRNKMIIIVGGFVLIIVVIVVIVLFLLLQNNNNAPTNQNNNSSSNNSSNQNPVSTPVSYTNADTITDKRTTYSSTTVQIAGTDYYSFDYCDNNLSVCYHYLLDASTKSDYPILSSLQDTMPVLISGQIVPSPAGNAAGNEYFVLNGDILINVIAKYVDKEVDPDVSTKSNYVFNSCANPAPPCVNYLVPESFISGIPFVANLKADDEVALSGELTAQGGAAGTQYFKMKTVNIAKL